MRYCGKEAVKNVQEGTDADNHFDKSKVHSAQIYSSLLTSWFPITAVTVSLGVLSIPAVMS